MKKTILSLLLVLPTTLALSSVSNNEPKETVKEVILLQTIKFPVNFTSKSTLIKGTWSNYSSWSQAKNTYFELSTIKDGSIYNFRYFENGVLTKNYTITYDSDRTTKTKESTNKNVNCYKINDSKDDWIYLYDTTMRGLMSNSAKWSESNDATISILDDEKTGFFMRIK